MRMFEQKDLDILVDEFNRLGLMMHGISRSEKLIIAETDIMHGGDGFLFLNCTGLNSKNLLAVTQFVAKYDGSLGMPHLTRHEGLQIRFNKYRFPKFR